MCNSHQAGSLNPLITMYHKGLSYHWKVHSVSQNWLNTRKQLNGAMLPPGVHCKIICIFMKHGHWLQTFMSTLKTSQTHLGRRDRFVTASYSLCSKGGSFVMFCHVLKTSWVCIKVDTGAFVHLKTSARDTYFLSKLLCYLSKMWKIHPRRQ